MMLTNELERIDTMAITDVVAYVNQLGMRLECSDCTAEERENGLALLRKLTERVRFLKIWLDSASSRAMCSHETDLHPRRSLEEICDLAIPGEVSTQVTLQAITY